MGAFATRIAAQDFVTPPEFAAWRLAAEGSARIGGARLSLATQERATRITHLYEQTPVRVLPFQFGSGEPTLVYLVNSTNSIMDGDAQRIEIDAGPGSRTVVTAQSATRIHPCLSAFCTQQWKVTVAAGAILVLLPGPAIPFAGCRYYQRVEIELGKNAHFLWGDIWFAGRYARGPSSERFRFEAIVQELLVRRGGQLVYRDRFAWHGPWTDTDAAWHFGPHDAVGSLFATGTHADIDDTHGASFATAAGDTLARWAGPSEAVSRAVVHHALRLAARLSGDSVGTPWLMTGHRLGPTHWFESREG